MSSPIAPATQPVHWPTWRKLGFRFLFVYFLLMMFPFPLDYIPGTEALFAPYRALWATMVQWTARMVLGIGAVATESNGSGDRTYDYVELLVRLGLSTVAAVVWTLAARHRPHHERLARGLVVATRYTLGLVMVSYGMAKVFPSQFPAPGLFRLTETYGESSPMGLLWTFMGHSAAYNLFVGLGEVVGGFLLMFRRTTTLGAAICTAILANIVALNFTYDVPVKLLSTHLLLMALALLALDARRLIALFWRPSAQPMPTPRAARWARAAFILATVAICADEVSDARESEERPPLYGYYEVTAVECTTPCPDVARWKQVFFEWPGKMSLRRDDREGQFYMANVDLAAGTLALTPRAERQTTAGPYSFRFDRAPNGDLTFHADGLRAHLTRQDESAFRLTSRGFRWINETPYNR